MPPRRKVDVVAPEQDLQADQAETDEDGGPQRVDLGPGLHHQGHQEQHGERAGAFQEEAERLAFHGPAILTDARGGAREMFTC
jgi:hypothetical protein